MYIRPVLRLLMPYAKYPSLSDGLIWKTSPPVGLRPRRLLDGRAQDPEGRMIRLRPGWVYALEGRRLSACNESEIGPEATPKTS
jgi:hypothetical protein